MGAFTTETAARLRALALRGRFEAHLTVATHDTSDAAAFDDACRALGVHCVLIALAEGAHRAQPMTASHHEGDLAQVLDEIDALHAALEAHGLRIVRAKLEAHVENPGIPTTEAEAAALGGYFEYHLKVRTDLRRRSATPRESPVRITSAGSQEPRNDERAVVAEPREPRANVAIPSEDPEAKIRALGTELFDHMSSLDADDVARIRRALDDDNRGVVQTELKRVSFDAEHVARSNRALGDGNLGGVQTELQRLSFDADRLRAAAAPHGAHVSANDRKPGQRFVTLRVYRATFAEAEAKLVALESAIADAGFAVTGTIREYTLADTRIELDAGWLDPP